MHRGVALQHRRGRGRTEAVGQGDHGAGVEEHLAGAARGRRRHHPAAHQVGVHGVADGAHRPGDLVARRERQRRLDLVAAHAGEGVDEADVGRLDGDDDVPGRQGEFGSVLDRQPGQLLEPDPRVHHDTPHYLDARRSAPWTSARPRAMLPAGEPDEEVSDGQHRRGRAAYAAFEVGDVPAVLGALADDVEWIEAEGFPMAGTYRGHDEVVQNVFMPLAEQYEGFTVKPETFVGEGDMVVSVGTYEGIYRATGRSPGPGSPTCGSCATPRWSASSRSSTAPPSSKP